jgi:hypothetical protein
MFKSTFMARNEIVRVLLALPSLHSAGFIADLSKDIKANERNEPETAFEFEIKRAPMSPLKAAKTELVGPDSRKDDEPFPTDSTPAPALAMFSAVALV